MADVKTIITGGAEPARRARAVMTVMAGADAGRVLPLSRSEQVTFGRAEDCTYAFLDGSLSRVHARVVHVAGEYMLKDEGSTNGSFVNDKRVAKVGHLSDGDRVQLGHNLSLRFSLVTEEEEIAMRRVYEAAMKDGLTGVFNRKHIDERLDSEIAFALRHVTPLSVGMIDIDHFKHVNDSFGHPAGDAVLRAVSQSMSRTMRTEDVLGRFGGEEFIFVARGIDLEEASAMAERLRIEISKTSVQIEGGAVLSVTASFGVASLSCCGEKASRENIISIADTRLYAAKEQGRNRVVRL